MITTDRAQFIRRFTPGDAPDLAVLNAASISQIGSRYYSPEQIIAWSGRSPAPDDLVQRAALGAIILISSAPSCTATAYALLDPDGHLDHLYCHPDHVRQGHASALLEAAEVEAMHLDLDRLYTEASEAARPVFERAGYHVMHRRDFEISGVAIHNYAMEKRIR